MTPAAFLSFLPSAGRRFTWLMSAMIGAAAAYACIALWIDIKAEYEEMSHHVMETSQLASERTEAYFRSWQSVIGTLAETDCLRLRRGAPCTELFARLNERFPGVVNFAALDRQGNTFASGRQIAEPERPNGRAQSIVRDFPASRRRVLMDPHVGPFASERVVGLVVPLSATGQGLDGLVGIWTRFRDLEMLWGEKRPYANIELLVLNRDGRIIHAQNGLAYLEGRSAHDLGLPVPLPARPGRVDFEFDGATFHAYLTHLADREWSMIAVHRQSSAAAGYFASERLGLKLFLPLAMLTILGGVLALRAQRIQRRLAESEERLQAALARTENEIEVRTRELAENEARYRALFDRSPNGVVITDLAGRIVEFNKNAAALLGYTAAEFARLSMHELESPANPEASRLHQDRIAEHGSDQFETRLRTRSGHEVDMLISVRTIELGSGPAILSVWTDLSPIQRIRELQRRLQSIVEASRDAIVLVDQNGQILYANPGTETLLGWPGSELRGQAVDVLIPAGSADGRAASIAATLAGKAPLRATPIEIDLLHRDGRRIPAELTLASWEEDGRTLFSGILRDVTERRQAQDRLQFTQKMEAVGILAGGIAHDFNNLLAIMLGHGQLIFDRASDNEPIRNSAEKINKAVLKARALIKQLLDFSRASDEAPKVMSLADELRDVEALIRSSVPRKVELRIESADTLGAVRAVPHQVQQVFINLINNACDAIGSVRGSVEVTLSEEPVDASVTTADGPVPAGRYVVARVLDTGPGISEEIHDRIFLPFFTTKEVGRGTGLGLAVVRNIMRQSQGYIRVFNRLSGGACFELYFPLVDSAPAPKDVAVPEIAGRGESVLFVDDEPEVVEAYSEYLKRIGFAPRVYASAADALAELQRHPDDVKVVVSDLVMPGMDGLEFAHAVHRSIPALPILLLTGRGERVTHHQMKTCGIAGLIAKPAEPRLLAAELRRALDRVGRRGA